MLRKYLLGAILLIVVLAAAISVAVYVAVNQNPPFKYEKSIVRNTGTAEEENALTAAENVNYTDIFNSRFPETSNPSANFIDNVVINYYDNRYESLKGKNVGVVFNYNANVSEWDKIHVVYVPPPENESIYAAKVRVLSSNGTILDEFNESIGQNRYAWVGFNPYLNKDWIDTLDGNSLGIPEYQASAIDFEFSNCYIVDMRIGYEEAYSNLSMFWYVINQTVILDSSFKPLFIRVQTQTMVS